MQVLNRTLQLTVNNCARCGGRHDLFFQKFEGQPNPVYSHWSMCPETSHPILLKVQEVCENHA